MAAEKRKGTTDPEHEPTPPRIEDAGDLGPVGERKLDRDQVKDEIWRDRAADPSQDAEAGKPARKT
jgi:hypothetical protein